MGPAHKAASTQCIRSYARSDVAALPFPGAGPSACETERRALRSRADLDGDAGGCGRGERWPPSPACGCAPGGGRSRCCGRCWRGCAWPLDALAAVLDVAVELVEVAVMVDAVVAVVAVVAVEAVVAVVAMVEEEKLVIADAYELALVERSMGGAAGRVDWCGWCCCRGCGDGDGGSGCGCAAGVADADAETRRTTRGSMYFSLVGSRSRRSLLSRRVRDDEASPFCASPEDDDACETSFPWPDEDATGFASSFGRTVSCDALGSAPGTHASARGMCTRS